MWSGDNVPTAGNTFGNPSYSGVIHATYVISPTLLNEVAFNYNGNRIAILPTGTIALPSGWSAFEPIFSGPNNDNRIPEIHLAGADRHGLHHRQLAVEQQSGRLPDSRRHLLDQRARTRSRWAAAGRFTRRSRTCSATPRAQFTFNGTLHRQRFCRLPARLRRRLHRTGGSRPRLLEQRFLGSLRSGQLARQSPPDLEPWDCAGTECRTPTKRTTGWATSIPTSTIAANAALELRDAAGNNILPH